MERIEAKLYAPDDRLGRTESTTPVTSPPLSPALGWQGEDEARTDAWMSLEEERRREVERADLRERAALRSIERRERKTARKAQDQAAGSSNSASVGTPRTAARHPGAKGGGGGAAGAAGAAGEVSSFEESPYPTTHSPRLSVNSGMGPMEEEPIVDLERIDALTHSRTRMAVYRHTVPPLALSSIPSIDDWNTSAPEGTNVYVFKHGRARPLVLAL